MKSVRNVQLNPSSTLEYQWNNNNTGINSMYISSITCSNKSERQRFCISSQCSVSVVFYILAVLKVVFFFLIKLSCFIFLLLT